MKSKGKKETWENKYITRAILEEEWKGGRQKKKMKAKERGIDREGKEGKEKEITEEEERNVKGKGSIGIKTGNSPPYWNKTGDDGEKKDEERR